MSFTSVPGFTTPPANHHWDSEATLPCRAFFPSEHRLCSVRPQSQFRSVVRRVEHYRVLGYSQFIQLIQQLTNMSVMFQHPVRMDTLASFADRILLQMGKDVHTR